MCTSVCGVVHVHLVCGCMLSVWLGVCATCVARVECVRVHVHHRVWLRVEFVAPWCVHRACAPRVCASCVCTSVLNVWLRVWLVCGCVLSVWLGVCVCVCGSVCECACAPRVWLVFGSCFARCVHVRVHLVCGSCVARVDSVCASYVCTSCVAAC